MSQLPALKIPRFRLHNQISNLFRFGIILEGELYGNWDDYFIFPLTFNAAHSLICDETVVHVFQCHTSLVKQVITHLSTVQYLFALIRLFHDVHLIDFIQP